MKKIILGIILLILVVGVILLVGCEKLEEIKEDIKEGFKGAKIKGKENNIEDLEKEIKPKEEYPRVSIYDLNMHPELYDRQNISVRGIIMDSMHSNCVLLADDNGLYVLVKYPIENRVFDFGNPYTGQKGAVYNAKGVFYNEKISSYSSPNFYLEATEPLVK